MEAPVASFRTVMEVRRTIAVTLAAVLGLGAACTARAQNAAPSSTLLTSTTSTTVAATTTVDPTKAAILAAYRAEWADVIAVDTTYPVRPLDPRLAAHAMGKQLTSVRQALTRLSMINHYERGVTELSPVMMEVAGDNAIIVDCIFDHSVEVDFRTDTPIETPNVGRTLDRFTMTRVNGQWYVSDSTVLGSGKTGDACVPQAG